MKNKKKKERKEGLSFIITIQTHVELSGISPIFLSNFPEAHCQTRHIHFPYIAAD
jgi:hypothetical protein